MFSCRITYLIKILTPAFISTEDPSSKYFTIRVNGSTNLFCIGSSTHGVYMHLILCRYISKKFMGSRSCRNELATHDDDKVKTIRTEV